ncbi:MAG: hypothetical protein WB473_13485, partial [Pedococcus sp.]
MTRNAWRMSTTWMLLLALAHTHWALGGTALLPPGAPRRIDVAVPVIDLIAIPLCLAGALTAWLLRPDQRIGKLRHRAWLSWPAQLGAAVMVGHVISNIVP